MSDEPARLSVPSEAWKILRDQVWDEIMSAAGMHAPEVNAEIANDATVWVMRRFAEYLDELG
jgi:hypothetical protein